MGILASGELAKSDQPRSRRCDPPSSTTAKTLPLNLHGLKGTGAVWRRLHLLRSGTGRMAGGARRIPIRWIVISVMESGIGPARVRFRSHRAFRSEPRRRGADRCGATGARETTTAMLHWRCRPCWVKRPGDRPAHVRNALASHTGGDTQDRSACGSLPSSYPADSPRYAPLLAGLPYTNPGRPVGNAARSTKAGRHAPPVNVVESKILVSELGRASVSVSSPIRACVTAHTRSG